MPQNKRFAGRLYQGAVRQVGASAEILKLPASALTSAEFTVSAWVRADAATVTNSIIFANTTSTAWNDGFVLYLTASGQLWVKTGSATVQYSNADLKVPNKWVHITVVCIYTGIGATPYDINLYVNGIPGAALSIKAVVAPVYTAPVLSFGGGPGSASYSATFAHPMVLNRGLSASEAAALYFDAGVPSGLVARWPLSELTGTTAADVSGNSNTATITSTAWVTDVVTIGTQRSSLGARTGLSTGRIVRAPSNLITNSEDFTAASWVPSAVTVTANQAIAPDGTMSADLILETAATSAHAIRGLAVSTVGYYDFSFYAKAAGRQWISVAEPGFTGVQGIFDLVNGTSVGGSMEDVGNGWYRCHIQLPVVVSVSSYVYLQDANVNYAFSSHAGDITKGVYLWGASITRAAAYGTGITPYVKTTSTAVNAASPPRAIAAF